MRLIQALGRFIRNRRLELGLSQQQVADALGLPRTNVCGWENGDRAIPGEHLPALATVLQVGADVLLRLHAEAVPCVSSRVPLGRAPLTPITCSIEEMCAEIPSARSLSRAVCGQLGDVRHEELRETFLRQTASELLAGHAILYDTARLLWTSPLIEGCRKYISGEDKEYEGHLLRLAVVWERERERMVFFPQVPFGVHAQDPRYRVDYLIVHSAPRLAPASVGLELDGDHGWKQKSDAERTNRLPFPVIRFDNGIVRSPAFLPRLFELVREKARTARISKKSYTTFLEDRRQQFEEARATA